MIIGILCFGLLGLLRHPLWIYDNDNFPITQQLGEYGIE